MKAIIVDDEVHNITNIENLLGKYCPAVTIIGTATSADEGKKLFMRMTLTWFFSIFKCHRKQGLTC
jgi:DNA-binding LytR/AlgR family response regulator